MQIIIDVHWLVYVWCVVIYSETAWNNLFINLMASECLLVRPWISMRVYNLRCTVRAGLQALCRCPHGINR